MALATIAVPTRQGRCASATSHLCARPCRRKDRPKDDNSSPVAIEMAAASSSNGPMSSPLMEVVVVVMAEAEVVMVGAVPAVATTEEVQGDQITRQPALTWSARNVECLATSLATVRINEKDQEINREQTIDDPLDEFLIILIPGKRKKKEMNDKQKKYMNMMKTSSDMMC